jgi:hypothetical protein
MQDQRESWADKLFWGVTSALGLVAVGLVTALYFNWGGPLGY